MQRRPNANGFLTRDTSLAVSKSASAETGGGSMNIPFTTALIAGSSRGIGRGIAVKLATEGVRRIAVHYCTRRDEAEKTAALLEDAGAEAVVVQADVSNACRAEEMVNEAARQLGGCDIFVHSVI